MSKPDGYCAQNKDGEWMLCTVAYDSYHATARLHDQLDASGQEQEEEGWQIKPVWLSETPPVPRELVEWIEQMRTILVSQSIPFHQECDDSWYSCPKSPEGCGNDNIPKDWCTCGEDARTGTAIAVLKKLEKILPEKREG